MEQLSKQDFYGFYAFNNEPLTSEDVSFLVEVRFTDSRGFESIFIWDEYNEEFTSDSISPDNLNEQDFDTLKEEIGKLVDEAYDEISEALADEKYENYEYAGIYL